MNVIKINYDIELESGGGNAEPLSEIDILRIKADKWDKLESAIAKEYDNEESDLCIIGEIAASHLGFL